METKYISRKTWREKCFTDKVLINPVILLPQQIFHVVRLQVQVSLCDSRGGMLKHVLDDPYIFPAFLIELMREVFTETVSAYSVITEVVCYFLQILLHVPLSKRVQPVTVFDVVFLTVCHDLLIQFIGYRERTLLSCFLLFDGKPVPAALVYEGIRCQKQDILYTHPEIGFQHEHECYPLVGAEIAAPFLHGGYDVFILLPGNRYCLIISHIVSLSYLSMFLFATFAFACTFLFVVLQIVL